MPHEVIERLREDVAKLRSDRHNTAWRWVDSVTPKHWRFKRHMADDIEALIDLVTGSKGIV